MIIQINTLWWILGSVFVLLSFWLMPRFYQWFYKLDPEPKALLFGIVFLTTVFVFCIFMANREAINEQEFVQQNMPGAWGNLYLEIKVVQSYQTRFEIFQRFFDSSPTKNLTVRGEMRFLELLPDDHENKARELMSPFVVSLPQGEQ